MERNLTEIMKQGIQAHQSGDLKLATQCYQVVLETDPDHPDANHNLGVLFVKNGNLKAALPFFEKAVISHPNVDQFWITYVNALSELGRNEEVISTINRAKLLEVKSDVIELLERKASLRKDETSKVEHLSIDEIKKLINLLNENKFKEIFPMIARLRSKLSSSAIFHNIAGVANQRVGELDTAIDHFRNAIRVDPKNAEAYNNLGITFQKKKALDLAVQAFVKAISVNPKSAVTHYNLGNVYKVQGKNEAAIDCYRTAIRIAPDYALAHNNLGIALKDQGHFDKAVAEYQKALALDENNAEAFNNLGIALQASDKHLDAIKAYKNAISINPNFADAYCNMGIALQQQGDLDAAVEAFNTAVSMQPSSVVAWVSGADCLEKWNKIDLLDEWLTNAFLAFDHVPPDLRLIRCKLDWRKKNYKAVFEELSNIELETISDARKQGFLILQAKNYERFNDIDKAYDCYLRSNSLAKQQTDYAQADPESYFQSISHKLRRLRKYSAQNVLRQYHKSVDFDPTFLVGFPRSGTTLLDTVLRSHPMINVVEEQPILKRAEEFLYDNGYDDFLELDVPKSVINKARDIYINEFRAHRIDEGQSIVNIDKLPLNLLQVPLIKQLFPDAKFIFALRHPLDTILSCWMQNFKLNAAMANMVDLDRIVDFYCVAMETFQICRQAYDLSVHEVKYENLIANIRNEITPALDFLKLHWEPSIENYQITAFDRGKINTPSYSQVIQPIYQDAKYRWKKYENYLSRYTNQLEPWMIEFGYSDEN